VMRPVYYTAAELAARGSGDIPAELVSNTHLIYSSPATLAFNSPGAEGYGVKRAGLAVPESVMLIISPGCCGRNTSAISRMPGYEDRFFYLTMNETDLVTGRHLKKIPKAVAEICRGLEIRGKRPRAVMLCITCVDALLGTDMERICRRAQEKVPGVRVQPCYMYALTREGRKPPMVHVRQSIYELLEPRKKRSTSVNLLGFFAPLAGMTEGDSTGKAIGSPEGDISKITAETADGNNMDKSSGKAVGKSSGSELPDLLRQAGVRRIRQIGACRTYDAFQEMAEANFNLVLNPEARPAAYDLQERLGIPFIELARFYQIDRIEAQYAALGRVLQTTFDDQKWKAEALEAVADFRSRYPDAVFSIGEAMNGNPFELACALVREDFAVREIFGTVGKDSYVWLGILARLSPETRIYSNLHPTMLHYGQDASDGDGVTISIGRDAGWYHQDLPNVQWITDVQPFGYRAVTGLFRALADAMEGRSQGAYAPDVSLGKGAEAVPCVDQQTRSAEKTTENGTAGNAAYAQEYIPDIAAEDVAEKAGSAEAIQAVSEAAKSTPPAGFRRHTTPFAPDQSGAVSVLYDMGGICVICDAGGCTGNICGFDEPRWFGKGERSAVFSAGLRDMDAILGRDDRLVEKLTDAAKQIPASFASIVGTPVPAVIGTDYRALCRMAEKRTGLPVLGVNTDGMEYYDRGMEKAYMALLETFCQPGKADRDAGQDPAKADPGKSRAADLSAENRSGRQVPADDQNDKTNGIKTSILGIWGFSPLDFAGILTEEDLRAWANRQGYDEILCPGAGTDVEALRRIGSAEKNLVLSPAGRAAARWLETRYGTPWEYAVPDAGGLLDKTIARAGLNDFDELRTLCAGGPVLVVHQQVLAHAFCDLLAKAGIEADTASFFQLQEDLRRPGDTALREETDIRTLAEDRGYTCVIGDRSLAPILAGLPVRILHLPHFAVSGEQA